MIGTFAPRGPGEERGAILILAATVLVALIATVALVVDIGRQSMTKRQLHTIADIAAEDAVSMLGDANALTNTQTEAYHSAVRNNLPNASVGVDPEVHIGTWTASTKTYTRNDAAGAVANAVEVIARTTANFSFISGSTNLTATAIAIQNGQAGVEVGSYAVNLSVNNSVLGGLIGNGPETVTLLGYQGLAATNLTLGQLAAAAGFASPYDLLNADVTYPDVFNWAVTALNNNGGSGSQAAIALGILAASANSGANVSAQKTKKFQLRRLFGYTTTVGAGNGSAVSSNTTINLWKLATAAPEVALMDGQHAVSIGIPVSVSIPGLASISANLQEETIEVPQSKQGPVGTTVAQTAQIRAVLELTGQISVTIALVPTLVSFDIPVVLQGFGGSGQITGVNCATNAVTIGATPSAATVGIGDTTGLDLNSAIPNVLTGKNLLTIAGVAVLSGSVVDTIGAPTTPASMTFGPTPTDPFNAISFGPTPARGAQSTSSTDVGALLQNNLEGAQRTIHVITATGSNVLTAVGSSSVSSGGSASFDANFSSGDVGRTVTGAGIPAGATIVSVQSAYSATISANATSANANDAVTVGSSSTNFSLLGSGLTPGVGSILVNSVLNPVLGVVDSILTPIGQTLGLNVAGLNVWNPAWQTPPGVTPIAAPPGINCSTPALAQ